MRAHSLQPAAVLKRRANFVWIALKSGVRWLVGINNYVGLVAVLILAGAGAPSYTTHDWWLSAFIVAVVLLVTLSNGA